MLVAYHTLSNFALGNKTCPDMSGTGKTTGRDIRVFDICPDELFFWHAGTPVSAPDCG
jgi:hypothetical protein